VAFVTEIGFLNIISFFNIFSLKHQLIFNDYFYQNIEVKEASYEKQKLL
jgi:hypothetical protein